MATIHNTDLTKEIKNGAKLQQLRDIIPSQLADKVVPVMEVNPKLLREINLISSNTRIVTGTHVLYTAPTTARDVYIKTLTFGVIKDAACDSATGSYNIDVVQDGETKNLFRFPVLTLTAQQQIATIVFDTPIKIDRGTSISMGGTYTAGLCVRSLAIAGFILDNPNA